MAQEPNIDRVDYIVTKLKTRNISLTKRQREELEHLLGDAQPEVDLQRDAEQVWTGLLDTITDRLSAHAVRAAQVGSDEDSLTVDGGIREKICPLWPFC